MTQSSAALRNALIVAGILVFACGAATSATAQGYPHSTVKMIVPTTAGGAVDAFARGIGRRLEQAFGITVVVENRAGANGVIGAEFVARSPADGSTLMVIFPSHVLNPLFTKNVPFDPINDFAPVIRIGNIPLILVTHPGVPVASVADLIALAKAQPGKLLFASGGVGSGGHLSGELFKFLSKTDVQHVVYRGNAVALTDVLGGHVSMMFDTITTGLQHTKDGKLKLLAVTTAQRSLLLPDTPTMIEAALPGFDTSAWYAVLAPARTPRPVIDMLNAELNKAFADPAFRDQFAAQGVQFVGGSADDLGAFMRNETKRWGEVIESTGMKVQ
jgi:tripartite-type tricarboxylate transporter receptor subunit TctC